MLTANTEKSLKEKKEEDDNGKIFFNRREGTKISIGRYKIKFLESEVLIQPPTEQRPGKTYFCYETCRSLCDSCLQCTLSEEGLLTL